MLSVVLPVGAAVLKVFMEFCSFSDEEGSVRCQRIGRRTNVFTFAPSGAMNPLMLKCANACFIPLLLQRFEISSNNFIMQPDFFNSLSNG